jgi:hypothetical protein
MNRYNKRIAACSPVVTYTWFVPTRLSAGNRFRHWKYEQLQTASARVILIFRPEKTAFKYVNTLWTKSKESMLSERSSKLLSANKSYFRNAHVKMFMTTEHGRGINFCMWQIAARAYLDKI